MFHRLLYALSKTPFNIICQWHENMMLSLLPMSQ